MAVDISKVKLGVCDVSFGGVDLGATKGGVEVSFETNTYQVKIDQTGETAAKDIITGRMIKVKVPLAESDLAKLGDIIPGVEKRIVSTVTVGVRVDIGINIDMFDIAKELKLHPTGKVASYTDEDFGLFKAAPTASFSFTYQTNQERIYELEFTGYPDVVYGGALGWFGKKWDLAEVYWGRTTGSTLLTESTLEALAGVNIRGTRKGTVTFIADPTNTTLRLAWPADFDTGFDIANSVINNATGNPIVMVAGASPVTVVGAADGVSRSYKTYHSAATLTGAITATVS